MRSPRLILLLIGIGFVFVLCLCSSFAGAPLARSPSAHSSSMLPSATAVSPPDPITALLHALAQHAWDPAAQNGLGDLWWTWRNGADAGVNFNAAGTPSPASASLPNDPVLDLDVLDALWRDHAVHPADTVLDGLRTSLTHLVQHLAPFPQALDDGVIILTLHDLTHHSGDPWYDTLAASLTARDAATLYHPALGAIYWVDDQHPQGWYRTAETLELAAAFAVEGQRTGHPDWMTDAQHAVAFIQAHAYLPLYHVFLSRLGTVVLSDGSANPNEAILRAGDDGIPDDGGAISVGDIAREAMALLTISAGVQDASPRQVALTLLNDELPSVNHLNLWDTTGAGYFALIAFPGDTYAYAGRPAAPLPEKHPSDQALLLRAFTLADAVHPGTAGDSISRLHSILTTQAIDPAGPGVIARLSPTWQPLPVTGGGTHDWYDSRAVVQVVLALLASTVPPAS